MVLVNVSRMSCEVEGSGRQHLVDREVECSCRAYLLAARSSTLLSLGIKGGNPASSRPSS